MKFRREIAQSLSQIRGTANIYATITSHKSSITAVTVIKAIQIYCIDTVSFISNFNYLPSTHCKVQNKGDGLSQVWGQAVPHSM